MSHDHASSLLVDASRDLSFVSSLLEKAPILVHEHSWAVRIIMNTAIERAERALKIVDEVQS